MAHPTSSIRIAAVTLAAILFCSSSWASLALSPGLVQFEGIRPGAPEVELMSQSASGFLVHNTSEAPQAYHLIIESPAAGGKWELGYEPLPDAKWCRIEPSGVEVAAKSTGKFKVFIKVPDLPEYYNRKFMAYVICAPGKAAPPGGTVGLRVAARLQLETSSDQVKGLNKGAGLAIAPGELVCGTDPGAEFDLSVKVFNNHASDRTFTVKRLEDAVADMEKHSRYIGQGYTYVGKNGWASTDQKFAVKANESAVLKVQLKVPADAKAGQKYEDLLFVFDGDKCVNFLRVRFDLPVPQGK